MARPAKAIQSKTGTITKEETEIRLVSEKRLRGRSDNLRAPSYLTNDQKKIFRYIIKELEASEILGNLDIYILTQTAIAIDRLQTFEMMINDDSQLLLDNKFMASRSQYTKDFYRCCNELSLSPQARAKFSITAVNAVKEKKNPLLEALED